MGIILQNYIIGWDFYYTQKYVIVDLMDIVYTGNCSFIQNLCIIIHFIKKVPVLNLKSSDQLCKKCAEKTLKWYYLSFKKCWNSSKYIPKKLCSLTIITIFWIIYRSILFFKKTYLLIF